MLEEAMAAVPAELLGSGLIWGTQERVANKLRVFYEAGVRHMVLFPASALLSRRTAIHALLAILRIACLLKRVR